MKEKLETH